jgi:hypothetical protein
VLDRETGVLAGKLQDLIHGAKKLLRLFRRNDCFLCGAGALARGSLGWSGLRLIVILILDLEAKVIDTIAVCWRLRLLLRPRSANQQCE